MDRIRWEILVLAAAILVGALVIASSMRANRYAFASHGSIYDTQTGEVYKTAKPGDIRKLDNLPKEEPRAWLRIAEPIK